MSVHFITAIPLLQRENSLRGLYPISSEKSDLDFISLNLSYTWGFKRVMFTFAENIL